MKTEEQIKDKWNECLKARQEHASVIDHFTVNPPTSEHENNSLSFAKSGFAHLSAWLQALEFVMK